MTASETIPAQGLETIRAQERQNRLRHAVGLALLHPRVLSGYRRVSRFGSSSEPRILGLLAMQIARSMPATPELWNRALTLAFSVLGAR
jgi:hypothetical protein